MGYFFALTFSPRGEYALHSPRGDFGVLSYKTTPI